MANLKLEREIKNLTSDASNVVKDITSLSRKLKEAGADQTEEAMASLTDEVMKKVESSKKQLEDYKSKIGTLKGEMDVKVREKPYHFILGSLAAGLLLGKLFPSTQRS